MATQSEVQGIKKKKQKAVVVPLKPAPENQFLPKSEFIKRRLAQKRADMAAEEARLSFTTGGKVKPSTQVELLRKQLAAAEAELADNVNSDKIQRTVKILKDELESLGESSEKEAPKTDEPAADPLANLRKKLANAQSQLDAKPDSKAWAKKVKDLSEELEAAEAQ